MTEVTNYERQKKDSKELIDDYDYLTNAASAMDFTGLIPHFRRTMRKSSHTTISSSFFPL